MRLGGFSPLVSLLRAGFSRSARRRFWLGLAAFGLLPHPAAAAAPVPVKITPPVQARVGAKPRILILTDIGNEPDDSESLVRLLLYANEFDIAAIIATTSTWQRDRVRPDLIDQRLDAYAQVWPNLTHHADGYPSPDILRQRRIAGAPLYGMKGVGKGHDTKASAAIIAAVDAGSAERPLWVLAWSGVTDLAQALWHIRATRSPAEQVRFLSKLRVYSISDQDDAGPWARLNFPSLFWIASIHGWGQYNMAAWTGISGDRRSAEQWPDRDKVQDPWLEANIRRGPLGALYPLPAFIMEGDTPSLLYMIPNGLSDPERPDWGSWGGRYMAATPSQKPGQGLYADTKDVFTRDGALYAGNQATIYRWRGTFQNDFAARMAWTLTPDRTKANHAPQAIVNGEAGRAPLRITAKAGETIHLDAVRSHDPDGDAITAHWWQYRDVGGIPPQAPIAIAAPDAMETAITLPKVTAPRDLHMILELSDHGAPAMVAYRRIIISVLPVAAAKPAP